MDSALLPLAGAIFLCINFFPKSLCFASTFNVFFEKVSKFCRVLDLHQNFALCLKTQSNECKIWLNEFIAQCL
jgi:hypothetical protein